MATAPMPGRRQQRLENAVGERPGDQKGEGLGGPDDHLPCREDAPLYLRRNFALPDGLIEAADKWYGKVRAQRARGDQRRGGAHAHQSEMS